MNFLFQGKNTCNLVKIILKTNRDSTIKLKIPHQTSGEKKEQITKVQQI